jgi:hypothetical protein
LWKHPAKGHCQAVPDIRLRHLTGVEQPDGCSRHGCCGEAMEAAAASRNPVTTNWRWLGISFTPKTVWVVVRPGAWPHARDWTFLATYRVCR